MEDQGVPPLWVCPEAVVQCVWYEDGPLGIHFSQNIPWAPVIVALERSRDEMVVSLARHRLWWREPNEMTMGSLHELVGREVLSVGEELTEGCTIDEVEAMVDAFPRPMTLEFGMAVAETGRKVRVVLQD